MQKKRVVFYVYVIFCEQSGQAGVENGALHIYSDVLQNAPFRNQIFTIFFASGGQGALTHLNQNSAMFLNVAIFVSSSRVFSVNQSS